MGNVWREYHRYLWTPLLVSFLFFSSFSELAYAQGVSPITSSGLNTQISKPTTSPLGKVQIDITDGTRAGGNLFHSFGSFNIPPKSIANFLNNSKITTSNIIGRVTGGSVSNIFGTLQTTGFGSANLFLMNPAGIVFGPAATLNVGGSVTFTTADYLRFENGVQLNALQGGDNEVLTASPVSAYGFLGTNPSAMTVRGSQLKVPASQDLVLVGGNLTIQNEILVDGTVQTAQLSAPGGKVHLASVASPGELLTETLAQTSNVNGQSFGTLGTIQVSSNSVIDTSGDGGGTVLIRGGRFILDESIISANTTGPAIGPMVDKAGAGVDIVVTQDVVIKNEAVIESNVNKSARPGIGSGGVRVRADRIELFGTQDFVNFPFTGIRSNVVKGSAGGSSGDIVLEANSISIKDFAGATTGFETRTESTGHAGAIILRSTGDIDFDNGLITTQSQGASASGNSGNIELTSSRGSVFIRDTTLSFGPFISSGADNQSKGSVGNITVNAPEGDILVSDFALIFTSIQGSGGTAGSGGIQLTARNLFLENSGIQVDNFIPLVPGDISVNVSGNLRLSGTFFNSRIQTTTRGVARSSTLSVLADSIFLTDGSFLSTETTNSGSGGALNILANSVQITNGSQLRSNSRIDPRIPPGQQSPVIPSGAGGMIKLSGLAGPANTVLIDGIGSGVFTNTQGVGQGGDTSIIAQDVSIQNGAVLSASTTGSSPSALGGTIAITAIKSLTVNSGGSITANASGPANAGDIILTSKDSITINDSSLSAKSDISDAGNIKLTAPGTIRLVNSQISTSVGGGPSTIGGNINIDPQFVILQNSQIVANAFQGQGGAIDITTQALLTDSSSVIDASSQFGVSGTVNVQSPTSNVSQALSPLPEGVLSAAALLRARCAARKQEGNVSSFTEQGRDSLPTAPGAMMPSPLLLEGMDENSSLSTQISQGRDWLGTVTFKEIASEDPENYVLNEFSQACSS